MPISHGAEIGAALIYLLPYYGFCDLAMVRAALRRRRYPAGSSGRSSLAAIARRSGPDHRPLAG